MKNQFRAPLRMQGRGGPATPSVPDEILNRNGGIPLNGCPPGGNDIEGSRMIALVVGLIGVAVTR